MGEYSIPRARSICIIALYVFISEGALVVEGKWIFLVIL